MHTFKAHIRSIKQNPIESVTVMIKTVSLTTNNPLHQRRESRTKILNLYLQKDELIPQNGGLFILDPLRGDEGFEELGSESRDVRFRQNAFFMKAHQIEDFMVRILLPFEIISLLFRQLLLGWR